MNETVLIDICAEIGSVAESNGGFTFVLALRLAGRDIKMMSVGELLDLICEQRVSYNKIHAKG